MKTTVARTTRHWFQFSLRTLLLMTLVSGAAFGSLYRDLQEYQTNSRAMTALAERGFDLQTRPGRLSWLWRLLGSDAQLITAAKANGFNMLQGGIVDDDTSHLQELWYLTELNLKGTIVSDDALANIRHLRALEKLNLSGTRASDAGLHHLRELESVEELHLNWTQITDAGLPRLYHLKQLKSIELSGTKVTEQGIAALQSALPGCAVKANPSIWAR